MHADIVVKYLNMSAETSKAASEKNIINACQEFSMFSPMLILLLRQ